MSKKQKEYEIEVKLIYTTKLYFNEDNKNDAIVDCINLMDRRSDDYVGQCGKPRLKIGKVKKRKKDVGYDY